jgi:hypothetical protein
MCLIGFVRRAHVLASVLATALAGCHSAEQVSPEPALGPDGPPVTFAWGAEALRVGDTTSVTVAPGPGRVLASVRWTTSDPNVLAIDTTTAATPRVRVRAVGAGSATLKSVVALDGQEQGRMAATDFRVTVAPAR